MRRAFAIAAFGHQVSKMLADFRILPVHPGRPHIVFSLCRLSLLEQHPPERIPRRGDRLRFRPQRSEILIERPRLAFVSKLYQCRSNTSLRSRKPLPGDRQLVRRRVHRRWVLGLLQ